MNTFLKTGFFAAVASVCVLGCGCSEQQATTASAPPAIEAQAPGVLMAKMNSAQKAVFARERMTHMQHGGPGAQGPVHGNMSVRALSMVMSRMSPQEQRAYIAKNHLPGPGTAQPQR